MAEKQSRSGSEVNMTDKIWYEQAFYGSGVNGYQVLKNSAPQYDSIIEKICGAIGTPDGFSKMSQFLINYPHGDMIFMGSCVPGPPDRYNRKTLFFHIIYGSVQKNIDGNINIFSLLRNNIFSESQPEQCPQIAIAKNEKINFADSAPFVWNKKPLAIQCDSPQNELMEQLLGREVNNYAWASFSFTPLLNFRLYAISEYSSTPVNIACCDIKGNVIQNCEQPPRTIEPERPHSITSSHKNKKRNFLLYFFIISLLVNAILLLQSMSARPKIIEKEVVKEVVKEVPGPVQTRIVEKVVQLPSKPVDMKKLRKEILADIANSFPHKDRIMAWDKELSRPDNNALKLKAENPNAKEYRLLRQFKVYVDFVNNNILTQLNEGE